MIKRVIGILLIVYGLSACEHRPSPSPLGHDNPITHTPRVSTEELPSTLTQNQADRSIWQRPDIVMSALGEVTNKTVADLGAGTGYFTWRLIPHVEKVIAIDIDDQAIQYLDSMSTFLPESYKDRLSVRKAEPDNAHLSKDEADVILIVNTYTYLPERINYMQKLRDLLPEGGEVLIIDFKRKRIPIGPAAENRVALYKIEEELEQAGFSAIETDDQSLNYQYIIKARK